MCAIMDEKNKKEGHVRQRNYMHSLAQLQRLFTGATTFSLFPLSDYSTCISEADKIAQNSWERTGFMVKQAIDNNRGVFLCKI